MVVDGPNDLLLVWTRTEQVTPDFSWHACSILAEFHFCCDMFYDPVSYELFRKDFYQKGYITKTSDYIRVNLGYLFNSQPTAK